MMILFLAIVETYIYNSLITLEGDTFNFKVKISKDIVKPQSEIELTIVSVPLLPVYYYFSNEKWLGLPWKVEKTVRIKQNDTVDSKEFVYVDFTAKSKNKHYFSVFIKVNTISFFTNPIYKMDWSGLFYPVKLNLETSILKMNKEESRACLINNDDFTYFFYMQHIPIYSLGITTGFLLTVYLIRKYVSIKNRQTYIEQLINME
ncbi:hypothetical protein NUSPORA_01198 [Nucleospora cyclopteri]